MKHLLTILLFLPFAVIAQPTSNAGADQTIYLTKLIFMNKTKEDLILFALMIILLLAMLVGSICSI